MTCGLLLCWWQLFSTVITHDHHDHPSSHHLYYLIMTILYHHHHHFSLPSSISSLPSSNLSLPSCHHPSIIHLFLPPAVPHASKLAPQNCRATFAVKWPGVMEHGTWRMATYYATGWWLKKKTHWTIWVRQLGSLFPIYLKIEDVPNHQPGNMRNGQCLRLSLRLGLGSGRINRLTS